MSYKGTDTPGCILTRELQDLTNLPRPNLSLDVRERLLRPMKQSGRESKILSQATPNPSIRDGRYKSQHANGNGNSNGGKGSARRYFAAIDDGKDWPPELNDYNKRFAKALEGIKRRHDSVVTTVGKTSHLHIASCKANRY